MNHNTNAAPASVPASLFGPPAIKRRASPPAPPAPPRPPAPPSPRGPRRVSAVATGRFKLTGSRLHVTTVDVHIEGIIFSVLIRGKVVVAPFMRGETAVTFSDPELDREVQRVAVGAARDAEARGWLA